MTKMKFTIPLLFHPPGCGNYTMLRDITRNLSDGIEKLEFKGVKVGLIDERSEIAAYWEGASKKGGSSD